jgi:hypothetical protein
MSSDRDAREHVLIGYGEVMAVVQDWELALAIVWWRTSRKRRTRPSGDFDTPRSQKEVTRLEAAFLRKTVQELREDVAPHLEHQTADDLEGLIGERNRLAHRFLREQKAAEGPDFEPGTHDELLALGNRFDSSRASIMQTLDSLESYDGPVPEHWPEIAERIMERVFSGRKIPRDPREQ